MACPSLQALPRACGTEGVVAGVEKVFMITFNDLAVPTGSTVDEVYTTSTNGMVDAIGLVATKKYVGIDLLKSTSGLDEALTKDTKTGTSYMTQTFKLVLSDLTSDNKTFIESVLNQPVSVLLKTKTGKYFVAGLNGQMELSALEGGTGTAEGDLIGYNLTFTGISTKMITQVDPTIVADLINP